MFDYGIAGKNSLWQVPLAEGVVSRNQRGFE